MVLLRCTKLRRWETALLIGLACAMLWGAALGVEQDALANKVVRLHVVANSDSEADQTLKGKVRDAVLEEVTPDLAGLSRQEALETLERELPRIAGVAAEVVGREGYDYPVRASIREEAFPTKRYDGFALPAGDYTALRIQLGEGDGQNWWCVVFPPLCMGAVEEGGYPLEEDRGRLEGGWWSESDLGLDRGEIGLITGETQGYVVKFKAMELWEKWKARLS